MRATVLTSSIRFAHRPALVQRRLGRGRVVTCGFGADAVAQRASGSDELVRVLRRWVGCGAAADSDQDLGVAVAGYGPHGGMGSVHGTAAGRTDGMALVAVVDPVDDRRKAAEDEFPGVAAHDTIDAVLADDAVDVETFVDGFEQPCRAWHSELTLSGGAIHDWGSHHLDWIMLLLDGAPASVTTTRHKRVWHEITNDDQVRVRLAWADGREAEFLQSDVAGVRRPKLYVQGTEGTVAGHYRPVFTETVEQVHGCQRHESHHAEAPVELTLARYERGYGLTHTTLPPLPAEPWPFHRNVADHLLLGEPLEVDAADVRRVIGLLEAAQRSGDEGGTVELEPAG